MEPKVSQFETQHQTELDKIVENSINLTKTTVVQELQLSSYYNPEFHIQEDENDDYFDRISLIAVKPDGDIEILYDSQDFPNHSKNDFFYLMDKIIELMPKTIPLYMGNKVSSSCKCTHCNCGKFLVDILNH